MKKILGLFLVALSFLGLIGCKKQLENPVTLAGLSASTTSSTAKTKSKMGYKLDTTTPDYQFVVLMNDTTNFELTIKLDNPNDYHIFDFTLTCEDTNAKVFVEDEYVLLTDIASLNWRGATNSKYILKMQVSSEEFVNTINLTSMYYSDRTDGSNKYDVDLNDKGTIDVYRLYDGIEVESLDYFSQKINIKSEYVDTTSIRVNGLAIEDINDFYLKAGENTITYDFLLGDNVKYSSSIKFNQVVFAATPLFYGYSNHDVLIIVNKLYATREYNYKIINKDTNEVLAEGQVFDRVETIVPSNTTLENSYILIDDKYVIDWKFTFND